VAWIATEPVVSSDSRYVLARDRPGAGRDPALAFSRYPIDGNGSPLPVRGMVTGDVPIRWSDEASSMWVLGADPSATKIFRVNVDTGQRTFWRELAYVIAADPAGLAPEGLRVLLSADGKSYVYGYMRGQSDLYLADGVK
jgi:hypothetical protein